MRKHRYAAIVTLLLLIAAVGCQRASKDKPAAGSDQGSSKAAATGSGSSAGVAVGSGSSAGSAAPAAPAVPDKDIDSKDILARTDTAKEVSVKHVLIGWKDLGAAYQGHLDP